MFNDDEPAAVQKACSDPAQTLTAVYYQIKLGNGEDLG